MPVKFGLWRVDGDAVEQVPPSGIASEERLEDILELRIEILGLGNLFQIGRQVVTDFGKRLDLLAIDGQGDLYVIELKKDRTPREVVAQALEYGFWVQDLSFEAIRELYAKHHEGETSTRLLPVTSRRTSRRPSTPVINWWWSPPGWTSAPSRSSSTCAATGCRSMSSSSST